MLGNKRLVIEIGTREVRGVLFSSFIGRINIERMESIPVEGEEISSTIARILSAFPSDAEITLQLPGHLFMIRRLTLPFTDRKKIRKTIPFELDGILPFSVEELMTDSVLSHSHEKGSSVIALAIPKNIISHYLKSFPETRKPSRVIPDFISLLSLGNNIKEESGIWGIIEIDDEKISMVFISNGRPIMMRSLTDTDAAFTGEQLNSTIKSLQADGQKVERLYISGKGATHAIPLLKKVGEVTLLPAVLNGINSGEWLKWASVAGGTLSISEYSQFNMLGLNPEREQIEKILKAASVGISLLLAIVTVNLYLHYSTAFYRFSSLQTESRKIFTSIMPEIKKVVREDTQLKNALSDKKELLKILAGVAAPSYNQKLEGINNLIGGHPEITIRELLFEGRKLTISGDGTGIESDKLKRIFADIEGMENIMVEEMAQGIDPNNYRFRIRIELI